MNDPHVVSLEYKLETDDTLKFDNPAPLERDAGSFTMRLADDVLTMTMKDHFATQEQAVAVVRPFILAWELAHALERRRRELRFTFVRSVIEDRRRTPGALDDVVLIATATVGLTPYAPTVRVTRRDYPEPPVGFIASPEVEVLWLLFQRYRDDRDALGRVAFLCLEIAETVCGDGDRKRTARTLEISDDVLDKLGSLAANKGDAFHARKLPAGGLQPFTPQEVQWIEAVMLKTIQRLGALAAGAPPSMRPLTMADLPKL